MLNISIKIRQILKIQKREEIEMAKQATAEKTPEQQIDAPISMVDVSNDVSISNRQSPVLVTERTHPKSVIIPVNIGFST